MATFIVKLYDRANKNTDNLQVVGRKVKGIDNYRDNYYVKKKNVWGVKWVCLGREGWSDSVATEGNTMPCYDVLRIVKCG